MEELVIDRREWIRGRGENHHGKPNASLMVRLTGPYYQHKCCLGFYALKCGYEMHEIMGEGLPSCVPAWAQNHTDLVAGRKFEAEVPGYWLFEDCPDDIRRRFVQNEKWSSWENVMAAINDNHEYTDAFREEALTELFALNGVHVTFIN